MGYYKDPEKNFCSLCKTKFGKSENYMYVVHDHIWEQSGFPEKGILLHMTCLEALLGRKLKKADFTDCLLNKNKGYC